MSPGNTSGRLSGDKGAMDVAAMLNISDFTDLNIVKEGRKETMILVMFASMRNVRRLKDTTRSM